MKFYHYLCTVFKNENSRKNNINIKTNKKRIMEIKEAEQTMLSIEIAEQMVIDFMDSTKNGSCEINGVRIEANRFRKKDFIQNEFNN